MSFHVKRNFGNKTLVGLFSGLLYFTPIAETSDPKFGQSIGFCASQSMNPACGSEADIPPSGS